MIVASCVNTNTASSQEQFFAPIKLDVKLYRMNARKQIYILLLLTLSSPVFASGGIEMAALLTGFYTLVVIAFWGGVLFLRSLQLYKNLWLLIISLLLSVASIALLIVISTVVKSEIGLDYQKSFAIASIVSLIVYAIFTIWTFIIPIRQYRNLNNGAAPDN